MCRLAQHSQILFLGRHPVRRIQRHQRLPPPHGVEGRPDRDVLHESVRARLDHLHAALVDGDIAGRLQHRAQPADFDFGRADAQVLRDTAIDRDAVGTAIPLCVDGHQLHVHEGGFARLVETLPGHHGVVPVQHLLAGLGIDVAGLETGCRAGRHRRWCRPGTLRDADAVGAIDGGPGKNESHGRCNDLFFHLRSLMADSVCAVGSGTRKVRSAHSLAVLASSASRSNSVSMAR